MTAKEADTYAMLEARLGHAFADRALCEAALTHKSWLNEAPGAGRTDNERLEFVSDAGLSKTAQAIGLGQWIFLGRGEDQAGGRAKASILSDALEALMGAVY